MLATSRMRMIRPLASARRIMSRNCSTVERRPWVAMVYWKTWPWGTGGWPIWPAGTWVFCCWTAAMTSAVEMAAGGHFFGVEPDAHAVVSTAHVGDVADAFEAGEFVLDLDGGEVGEVEVGEVVVGSEEVDDHEDAGGLLLDHDAAALDQVGEDGLGQGDAVLDEDLGHVEVDTDLEGDR